MQASQMTMARNSHKAQEARETWARVDAFVLKTTGKHMTGLPGELPGVLLELTRVLRGPRFVAPKAVSAAFRAAGCAVAFLEACEEDLQIPRARLFEPSDACGERPDERRVHLALLLVAREMESQGSKKAAPLSPSRHGAVPPPPLLRSGTPAAAARHEQQQQQLPAKKKIKSKKKRAAEVSAAPVVVVAAAAPVSAAVARPPAPPVQHRVTEREIPIVKTEYRLVRKDSGPAVPAPAPRSNSKSPRVRKLTAIAQLPEIKDRKKSGGEDGAGAEEAEIARLTRALFAQQRYAGLEKRVKCSGRKMQVEGAEVSLAVRSGQLFVRRGEGLQPLSTWLDRRFFLLPEEKKTECRAAPAASSQQADFDETEHLRWLLEKNTLSF